MRAANTWINGLLPTIVVLAALLLASCGGGGAALPGALDDQQPPQAGDQQIPQAPETGGEFDAADKADSRLLPLGTPLPGLPLSDSGAPARGASAVLDYLGADFMMAAGAEIDGSELVLTSDLSETAWAMYKADGLSELIVEAFSIEAVPGDLGQRYQVGFSNFDTGDWDFLIDSELPEAQIYLDDYEATLISALGNFYWLVTVDGGDSLRVKAAHLITAEDEPEDPGDPNDPPGIPMQLLGTIESIGDGQLTLISFMDDEPLTVLYDDNTTWFTLLGLPAGPEDFSAGDEVMLDALMTDDGWLALTVVQLRDDGNGDPQDPPLPLLLTGVLTEISGNSLTLGDGTVVAYNADTLWFTEDGEAGPDDFQVGDYVSIEAVEIPGAIPLALMVYRERQGDPNDPPVNLFGEIVSIGDGQIVLNLEMGFAFLTVLYNADTEWFTFLGLPAGPDDFAPGDLVMIDAVETDRGLLALLVIGMENGGGGEPGERVTIEGEILSIGEGVLVVTEDWRLKYDENTIWLGDLGVPLSPDQFAAGDWVLVDAVKDGDRLLAELVMKLRDEPNDPGDPPNDPGDPGDPGDPQDPPNDPGDPGDPDTPPDR